MPSSLVSMRERMVADFQMSVTMAVPKVGSVPASTPINQPGTAT